MEKNREMYREQILYLYKHPKNFGSLNGPSCSFHGNNASCGDDVVFELLLKNGRIEDVKFRGKSCVICTASASLLSEAIKEKKVEEIQKMDEKFVLNLLNLDLNPARLKCAMLPLETVKRALKNV